MILVKYLIGETGTGKTTFLKRIDELSNKRWLYLNLMDKEVENIIDNIIYYLSNNEYTNTGISIDELMYILTQNDIDEDNKIKEKLKTMLNLMKQSDRKFDVIFTVQSCNDIERIENFLAK